MYYTKYMNSHTIGDRSEAEALTALLDMGYSVLIPFGNGQRYDYVIEKGGAFETVQVKTANYRDGKLIFNAHSNTRGDGKGAKDYKGEVDWFTVYSPDFDKTYMVPVSAVGVGKPYLRIDPPKGGQTKNIRWAVDYEMGVVAESG